MSVFFATGAAHRVLTADDALAVAALAELGVDARPLVWTDTHPRELPHAAVVVLRSVWDYHLRADEFRAWVLSAAAAGVTLINAPTTVLWNIDKRYLAHLAVAGVDTIPTVWVQRGSSLTLADVCGRRGWIDVVVKPAVSASAYETWRVPRSAHGLVGAQHEERFAELLARRDVMVQRYVRAIETAGEWSVVFLGGAYSHAVIKRPRAGDFRVQMDHGGTREAGTPPGAVIRAAARAWRAIPGAPLYARIDGVATARAFLLMEAECIDPVLFFAFDPRAPRRFAEAIARHARIRLDHRAVGAPWR